MAFRMDLVGFPRLPVELALGLVTRLVEGEEEELTDLLALIGPLLLPPFFFWFWSLRWPKKLSPQGMVCTGLGSDQGLVQIL